VYALREVYGIGRAKSADVLDISVNTVDRHLADARVNAEEARAAAALLAEAGE